MRKYCPECGKAILYEGNPPSICGYCTSPLTIDGAEASIETEPQQLPPQRRFKPTIARPQTIASTRRQVPVGRRLVIEEEPEFDGTIPDVQHLDLEIELPENPTGREIGKNSPRGEKMEDIFGKGALGVSRPKSKKTDLRDFTKSIFTKKIIDLSPNSDE